MYSQLLALISSVCVFGNAAGVYPIITSDLPVCSLPGKPCNLEANVYHLNGTEYRHMNTNTCRCAGSEQCPQHSVISRLLFSNAYRFQLDMRFCHTLPRKPYCSTSQISIEVSGSTVPIYLNEYNCKCFRNRPLVLKEAFFGSDYLMHHRYICDYHMATCPRLNSVCFNETSVSTRYLCKCAGYQKCSPQGNVFGDVILGHCHL